MRPGEASDGWPKPSTRERRRSVASSTDATLPFGGGVRGTRGSELVRTGDAGGDSTPSCPYSPALPVFSRDKAGIEGGRDSPVCDEACELGGSCTGVSGAPLVGDFTSSDQLPEPPRKMPRRLGRRRLSPLEGDPLLNLMLLRPVPVRVPNDSLVPVPMVGDVGGDWGYASAAAMFNGGGRRRAARPPAGSVVTCCWGALFPPFRPRRKSRRPARPDRLRG